MSELVIAGLSAAPGQKVTGYAEVTGTPVKIPITLINGNKPGRRVLVTSGIHGGEYPGIETAIRLARATNPSEVSGQIIVVHPVNTPAFFARQQYVSPLDGKNLNRSFPGSPTGTVSERMAYFVKTELMAGADFYMDLHGGDLHEWLIPFVLYPTTGCEETTKLSRVAASYLGVPYIVGSKSETGTIGSAAKDSLPGILCEIGGCGIWNEQAVGYYLKGVTNVLRFLEVLPDGAEELGVPYHFARMTGLTAGAAGCWYSAVEPDQWVKSGDKLGEVRDFFGTILEEHIAPQEGLVLYVVSSLAVEPGDPVAAMGCVE